MPTKEYKPEPSNRTKDCNGNHKPLAETKLEGMDSWAHKMANGSDDLEDKASFAGFFDKNSTWKIPITVSALLPLINET